MAFDPAFGSFGDFLSIATLIKDIVIALDDSRGSKKKYQALIQNLGILSQVIEQVEKVYRDQRYIGGVDRAPVTALETAVSKIWQRLEDFSLKLRKYATSLSPGGSGNVLKDSARKIQFKIQEKDIEEFQRDILGYNTTLELLLEVTQMRMIQRNHDETIKHISDVDSHTKAMLDDQTRTIQGSWSQFGKTVLEKLYYVSDIGTTLQESTGQIFSLVIAMSSDITYIRSLVMRLERPLSDPHFVLEDAMGDSHAIYMKTITSWDTFEFVLQKMFVGKKGARRVLRGRYVLQDPSTKVMLDRSWDWEDLFMRRQRVYMRLFCTETKPAADAEKLKTCNRTYTRIIDISEDSRGRVTDYPSTQKPGHRSQGLKMEPDVRRSNGFLRRGKFDKAYHGNLNDPGSESDEEDVRTFDRIILISQKSSANISRTPLKTRQATDQDAERYNLPPGYSLKSWDPTKEPIVLLGSVFDANSLGKWIYDWTVYCYHPLRTASRTAGDLWLLLIQSFDKMKRAEEALPRIHSMDENESWLIEDFIESGERIVAKLEKLLETCEAPMLEALEEDQKQLSRSSGLEFVKTFFGRTRELDRTKRLMQSMRLWNMRFDANCEELLMRVSPIATSTNAADFARAYIVGTISKYERMTRASRGTQDEGQEDGEDSATLGESSSEDDV
ncbi:hypothetical protein VMCG_00071 [Cytospora schulzeri]|uniref:Ubiquitin-like domain-containing protein n=1 Tax=Cytospora schulzeri TaxID=448051 RepID=A0A423X9E3_9PEZI|nr:hypothetical protein VMCG_00071 [Valsa malicola]